MKKQKKAPRKSSRPRPTRTHSQPPLSQDHQDLETKPVELSYHQRCCKVCKHPAREAIEQDFLHWRSPRVIARQYKIRDRASIYRHAHANGLYSLRRTDYRLALENLIEHCAEVPVTATSIVRAVRACTHINVDNQWVEPPHRIVVTRETVPRPSDSGLLSPVHPREYYERQFQLATQPQTGKDVTR